MTMPKLAQKILTLPGVESLHKESDGWVCYLKHMWTTEALSGGGTIIDPNLKTIYSFVKGAYRVS